MQCVLLIWHQADQRCILVLYTEWLLPSAERRYLCQLMSTGGNIFNNCMIVIGHWDMAGTLLLLQFLYRNLTNPVLRKCCVMLLCARVALFCCVQLLVLCFVGTPTSCT